MFFCKENKCKYSVKSRVRWFHLKIVVFDMKILSRSGEKIVTELPVLDGVRALKSLRKNSVVLKKMAGNFFRFAGLFEDCHFPFRRNHEHVSLGR